VYYRLLVIKLVYTENLVNNNSSTRKKTTTKVDINVGPGLKQAQKCGRDKQLYVGVIQLYIKKHL